MSHHKTSSPRVAQADQDSTPDQGGGMRLQKHLLGKSDCLYSCLLFLYTAESKKSGTTRG